MTTINFNGQNWTSVGTTATSAINIGGVATGDESIAIGNLSAAPGDLSSMSLGYNSYCSDDRAIAIGDNASNINANEGVALGTNTVVDGNDPIALGVGADALAATAICLANGTASYQNSIVIGHSSSSTGDNGIAIGWNMTAGADECVIRNITGASGGGSQVFVTSGNVLNTNTSTAASKHNIRDLGSVDIMHDAFEPLRFTFNATGEESIGLIAEYVAEVFPEICAFSKDNRPINIRYDLLSVILCGTIRELEAQIDELEKNIA